MPKPRKAPNTSQSLTLDQAVVWANKNRKEWDFSRVRPEERPMAVAWEYGREGFDMFLRFGPFLAIRDRKQLKRTKEPLDRIHGNGLSHIFLSFWKSPRWPKKTFLDLSTKEKKEAFPKCFHEDNRTTSSDILNIVKDITPNEPYEQKGWLNLYKHFDLEDYILAPVDNPVKRVFLVDMDQGPKVILKSFKDHLNRAGFKQGRGRSTIEKDLLALSVHRLYQRFRNFKAMDRVLGTNSADNTSVLAVENNRIKYWNYAQGRLGRGWGRKGGKSKNTSPIFQFSWID